MQQGNAEWLVNNVLTPPGSRFRPWIVALAGFPAMGKSTLSELIRHKLGPETVVVLPIESCIMPRHERSAAGLSGSSPRAFNMSTYESLALYLLNGREVEIPVYSHRSGRFQKERLSATLPPNGCLVLDGIFTASHRLNLTRDLCSFFVPGDLHRWLEFADRRDRSARGYGTSAPNPENRNKLRDMCEVLADTVASMSYTIQTTVTGTDLEPALLYRVYSGLNHQILSDLSPTLAAAGSGGLARK